MLENKHDLRDQGRWCSRHAAQERHTANKRQRTWGSMTGVGGCVDTKWYLFIQLGGLETREEEMSLRSKVHLIASYLVMEERVTERVR